MKAVLFDLDRTLVDLQSYTDYGAALEAVETRVGAWEGAPTPATDWDTPTERCMSILFALSGDSRWGEVSDLIADHEMAAVPRSHPMPGLAEALARTRDYPRAVVTLVAERPARAALRRHGADIPLVIPRRADTRPKPAPDQVLAACRLLGVDASDTVMIGDSTWDAEAARGAGCRFVGVAATTAGLSRFGKGVLTAPDLVAALELAGPPG